MPYVDSMIFKKKGEKRKIKLTMEEDEKILSCIRQGMKENNVNEVKIIGVNGKIKSGMMNYLDGSKYLVFDFNNTEIVRASGNYKLSYDELFGSMRLTVGKPPINGVFSKGTATEGLEIELEFIELMDLPSE